MSFCSMSDTRNIKLLIAYDGTDFCGWQRQDTVLNESHRTVQGVIERALEEMHKRPVQLNGCGRTDSGVHAIGQVANFSTDMHSVPSNRFAPALNNLLPFDVRVLSSSEAPSEFHARFDAAMRTYRYHFICGRFMLPHESRYNYHVRHYPRLDRLNAYCRLLLGETDCSVFAAAGDKSKSRFRYISRASFFIESSRLIFEISANAFLWKMVRSVAGTFLLCDEEDMPPETLREIIASGDRSRAGPTLPPQGLFLWKVEY